MLVFGPFRAIPRNSDFTVFNLSSPTQYIEKLPGLFVNPPDKSLYPSVEMGEQVERSFDAWYYNYVLNDPTACSSLMSILTALYDGRHVYVCIADYINADYVSILNESFMKLIQTRYDIKYSIVNNAEDINYIPQDGCDFMSVMGIQNFDNDRKRYLTLSVENQIMTNTLPMNDDY